MDEQIADIAFELERLNISSGKAFVKQLELITNYKKMISVNRYSTQSPMFYGQPGKTQCPNCHGSGRCSGCNGTGRR